MQSNRDLKIEIPITPTTKSQNTLSPPAIAHNLSQSTSSTSAKDEKTEHTSSAIKIFTALKSKKISLTASANQAFLAQKVSRELSNPDSTRNEKLWVAKWSASTSSAYCEVVVQEFIRFLAPELHQPKARLHENTEKTKIGTATEYMDNYEPLWEIEHPPTPKEASAITPPPELGLATFLAYFFNETDLKPDHVGKQGTKIDSDYGLSSLLKKSFIKNAAITEANIQALPYTVNYNANQWLDQIIGGNRKKLDDKLIFAGLSETRELRNSVNKGILRLLTLSDGLITEFVDAYVPDQDMSKIIANFIQQQKASLLAVIPKNMSFVAYIATEQAKKDLNVYAHAACEFTTTNKRPIITPPGAFHKYVKHHHIITQQLMKPTSPLAVAYQSSSTSSDDKFFAAETKMKKSQVTTSSAASTDKVHRMKGPGMSKNKDN
jgi:hypothetical protein